MNNRFVPTVLNAVTCALALGVWALPTVVSAQSVAPPKRPNVLPLPAAPPVISAGTPAPMPTGVISARPPSAISRPIAPPRPGMATVAAKSKVVVSGNLPNGLQEVGYQAFRAPVGLASFKMSFTQPNRHMWRLSVAPETETSGVLGMYDGESGMAPIPVDYRATWIRIPGAVSGVVSTTTPCYNCNLSVPPGPPNSTLVLAGFDLKLLGPARFSLLSLMAGSTTSETGSRGSFDVGILSQPRLAANPASQFEAISVYYTWVPNSAIEAQIHINTDDPNSLKDGDYGPDVALRGFRIGYYDGVARRYQALGIHTDGSEPPTRSEYAPYTYASTYVTLSGEGLTPDEVNIGTPTVKYEIRAVSLR